MQNSTHPFLALGFVGLLLGAYGLGQPPAQEGELAATPVAGNVYYVPSGFGGNLGVSVGEDGVLLVDSLFDRNAQQIEDMLDTLSDAAPKFLVNTHTHGDHTGGNGHFSEQAVVVAHDNVRVRMTGEGSQGPPVVTHADGLSLHFNGEEIRLVHLPNAHTDGDTVVWFRNSNVFHMGDTYFQLGYPFIDTGRGGNVKGMIAGIRRVLDMAPKGALFIPGHGKVTDAKELEEYVEMLETLTERVQDHLEAGDDIKMMIELGITEEFDERWGGFNFVPPQRIIEFIVASLEAK